MNHYVHFHRLLHLQHLYQSLLLSLKFTCKDSEITLSPFISKYLLSNEDVTWSEPLTKVGRPVIFVYATDAAVTLVNSEPSPLNPTDELTFESIKIDELVSSHVMDLLHH